MTTGNPERSFPTFDGDDPLALERPRNLLTFSASSISLYFPVLTVKFGDEFAVDSPHRH